MLAAAGSAVGLIGLTVVQHLDSLIASNTAFGSIMTCNDGRHSELLCGLVAVFTPEIFSHTVIGGWGLTPCCSPPL